ncbi:C40 family peptidase [Marinobacter bohaiensis]|uniref:C40 family peptidase n=1 Tax=Marinobacter bohaiensis TaxID=2201898 RepID=UPI001D172263|nr:C40 family peptidase [Marinobacter bohaiensis]
MIRPNLLKNRFFTGSRRLGLMALLLIGLVGCAGTPPADPPPRFSTVDAAPASTTTHRLQAVFERYEGTPYRYGGTDSDGFDCSGFIMTAYREGLGRLLPRTTDQMLAMGDVVPIDRIKPGDLVFFRIEGKDQHAGIYMGGNRFIHASSSVGVTESALDGYYWRDRYSQARRFEH